MRLVLLNEKLVGEELAVSIYLSNGRIFANEGLVFNEHNIEKLKDIGIDTVYIKDGNSDVNLRELISTPIKIEVINDLKKVFDEAKKGKYIDEYKAADIVDKLIDNMDISENSFLLNNIGQRDNEADLVTHSINVTILCLLVGKERKFPREKLNKLGLGALLHDVGKLFDGGNNHCKAGYDFIRNNTRIPVTSYMCILRHHENVDGTGYPEKIEGEKIHEFIKIVSLCDSYSNLLQRGDFALPSMAIEYLSAQVGKKFDAEIYKSFIDSVYCYPNGLYVELNNGLNGIVALQNRTFPSRPIVGVVKDGCPVLYNLLEDLTVFIKGVIL